MRRFSVLAALMGACVMLSGVVHATAWGTRLAQVDAIRNQDAGLFVAQVRQLRTESDRIPPEQRDYFELLSALGWIYENDVDRAATAALRLRSTTTDDEIRQRARQLLVNIYQQRREYLAGLREVEELLAEAGPDTPLARRQTAWQTAAGFYLGIDQPALALGMVEQLEGSPLGAVDLCVTALNKLQAQGDLPDAQPEEHDFTAAQQACEAVGLSVATAGIQLEQARWLRRRNRPNEALALLESRLAGIEAAHYPLGLVTAYALIAQLYWQQGDASRAERFATRAVDMSRDAPTSRSSIDAREILYRVAKASGNVAMALHNHEAWVEANQQRLGDVAAREIAVQQLRQERQMDNALLEQRNQQLQSQVDAIADDLRRQSRLLVALALMLATSLAMHVWARRKRA